MADYPEHDKLLAIQDQSQAIGEFVDWLSFKGIWLMHYPLRNALCDECEDDEELREYCIEHHWLRTRNEAFAIDTPIERLLAEFFQIDYEALMDEKDAMLRALRNA